VLAVHQTPKMNYCFKLLHDITELWHFALTIHKEKSNKMQQCIKILLFRIYMKLNMFRVTHRPSSGA
jgi:hypothetical protein